VPPPLSRGDPLYGFSRRICAMLASSAAPGPAHWSCLDDLLRIAAELHRIRRDLGVARDRGWMLSAQRLAQRLPSVAWKLREAIVPALSELQAPPLRLPSTIHSIHQELLALQEEFGPLQLNARAGLLGVVTEPIVLQEVHLGRFRIDLRIGKLRASHAAGAFAAEALEPNPASCSDATTHPHVRDGIPCLGEAVAPVSAALGDGRLLDAFLAVASVLRSYNASSPYVALEDWHGRSCDDCGRFRSDDSMSCCQSCDGDFCSGCFSCCDVCDGTYCLSCLERGTDDENLCDNCRGRCSDCGEVASTTQLKAHEGRCRRCAELDDQADQDLDDSPAPERVPAPAASA